MKAKIMTAAIFLCAAISIAWLLLSIAFYYRSGTLLAIALAFGIASATIFLWPRLSSCLGLASGIVALHWFSQMEFGYLFPATNSWIAFNLPDGIPYFSSDIFQVKLRILFAVTVVTSTVCAVIRLLPASWVLRKIPLRERTWPAVAVCFLVVVLWYVASVSPYRIPVIVDGAPPELAVLHVEKRGVQFHETVISVYRNGRVYIERNDRRLFQYRFAIRRESGVLPESTAVRVRMLAQSTQLRDLSTAPPVALRNKNAEGWYVRTGHYASAFTTEYGTEAPKEVVDLFHDLESVALTEKELRTVNDVCMGFCYDPLAGLGLVTTNDRCVDRNGIHCK